MPKTIEITTYNYDELNENAREKAREWYLGAYEFDSEHALETIATAGTILGIEFGLRTIPLMNGKTRKEPKILFSGFHSTGDGACFEGCYSYAKGALKRLEEEFPTDTALHDIARKLQHVQQQNFYGLYADVTHNSAHYYHSGCTFMSVKDRNDEYASDDITDTISELLRDFMDWSHNILYREHEYQISEDTIAETMHANEYEFDENGKTI